jgi:outer membrane protein insertion porin family
MKVHALIFVLLAPLIIYAEPQQYYGTRLGSISISGTDTPTDLNVIQLQAGDLISADNIRSAIQSLYDTGRYSYIAVDAAPGPNGTTNLTFQVRPLFFFSTFRLEPENLLERPLSGYFRLPFGEKFSDSAVDRIVQDTRDLLRSEGYFETNITPEFTFEENTRLVFVTLRITPGPQATLGSVRITGGEETFSREELLDLLDLETADEFSSGSLDQGLSKIRTEFTELGFLDTRITDNRDRAYNPATDAMDLEVTIQPGKFTYVETRGHDISRRRLRELVPVFEEAAVDPDLVEEGRVQIDRYLQQEGYFEATVMAETIDVPEFNAIQINYLITPGVRHEVRSIRIEGNQHFSTDEIRRRLRVRTAAFLNRGVFSSEILDQDRRTIEAMYRNAGFQGTVVRTMSEEVDHAIHVVIQIEEGNQVSIDFVTLLGNYAVAEDELRKSVELKEGGTYTPVAVDEARAAITQVYYTKGFADVRVEPSVERVESNHGMRVTFQITEGSSYTIGKILVAGNTRTQEKIIHRYSNIYPNTPYNPEAILEGQQRLYSTGLFTRVEIVTLEQGTADVRNILIQVEDARPILLTYGIGYQEFEGVRGTIDISHTNLFGLDRSLSFRARGSRRERLFQTTYREPRLFNRNLDGFGSFFLEHTERPFFTADRIDFSVQILKEISPRQNLLFTMGYQTANQADIRVNPQADKLPAERGIFQIARLGTSFIQDRRNDPVNPSSGIFNTTTFQVASRAYGSELNFTSLFNLYSLYTPVPYGVLATSVRLGWNQPFGRTTVLPPTERYFAGGSTTLRGFDLDEALPSGGQVLSIANFEYRFPLPIFPISGIGGALFYDTGNAFPTLSDVKLKNFTHSAGFGLRYQTPLGPVRIDFGFNLKPRIDQDGNREERVQVFFTLGNPF